MIVGPTSPTPAFKLGEKVDDPLAMYLSDIYTISATWPASRGISIPCGFTKSGLPIGLQIQAAPFEEEKLLRSPDVRAARPTGTRATEAGPISSKREVQAMSEPYASSSAWKSTSSS